MKYGILRDEWINLKKGSDFIFELLPFSDINFLAILYLSSTLLTT